MKFRQRTFAEGIYKQTYGVPRVREKMRALNPTTVYGVPPHRNHKGFELTILSSDIVPLAILRSGIVGGPEHIEHFFV